jgi:hypothetical protein
MVTVSERWKIFLLKYVKSRERGDFCVRACYSAPGWAAFACMEGRTCGTELYRTEQQP